MGQIMAQHPRESLTQAFRSPDSKRRYVGRLFATIADRYDFITRFLSFGQDAGWKRRLVAEAAPVPGCRALDLACGTGDLASLLARQGATVVGLDLTPRMIALARQRPGAAADQTWLVGDMTMLPFGDTAFDVITIGYGLRNVPDLVVAVSEAYRVLAPGGAVCSLDFNRPASAIVRTIYLGYLTAVGSALGFLLHGDPDTYRYIPASIRRYPGAAAIADLMRRTGFVDVRHIPVLAGLMSIHTARRPRK